MYILALYECSRLNCYNVENSIIIERLVKKMYTTQMDAARKGIITKEMKIVAEKENMDVEELRKYMAEGKVIIPCNKKHTAIDPNGIGSMLKTKINVNLGISRDCIDMDMELAKVQSAVDMGAEAIMDLSSFGDTQKFLWRYQNFSKKNCYRM